MFGYLYNDDEGSPGIQLRNTYNILTVDEERHTQTPIIPIWAWDEYVEGQLFRDWRIPELTPENEWPAKLPPANLPPPVLLDFGEEFYQSYPQNRYVVFNYDYEDFWNPTLVSQINFFDDFEPDYSNIALTRWATTFFSSAEEEGVQIYPVPIQIPVLNSQFDDFDWNMDRSSRIRFTTTEEDLGVPPIFQLFIVRQEDEEAHKRYDVLFAPPDGMYEDFSLFANFPPPVAPTFDQTDETVWQHYIGYQFNQATQELDYTALPIIPTVSYEGEIEGSEFWNVNRGVGVLAALEPEDDNSGYGWFLNPFIPPPFVCNQTMPTGPDGDTSISAFGGTVPLQVLFCLICKSGKPLLVRGDYAIWCQDCCAFVPKQQTTMMTLRAPGQFKGIF